MYITSIQIKSYKSFLETIKIDLSPKFNVIIGPNNVGKTALLEALTLKKSSPHKGLSSTQIQSGNSEFHVEFYVSKEEFDKHSEKVSTIFIRLPESRAGEARGRQFIDQYNSGKMPIVRASIRNGEISDEHFAAHLSHVPYENSNNDTYGMKIIKSDSSSHVEQHQFTHFRKSHSYERVLATILLQSIYKFNAERFNIGTSQIGVVNVLEPDASNLPTVLHHLSNKVKHRYNRYLKEVQIVFPQILDISLPPVDNNRTSILLWEILPETERDDLAISIDQCGTGIAQVLAMLYVVVCSDSPQIILIDEPQSFLHPSAIRKLFEIFKKYPQHQYIITTHSPLVISATDPDTILLLSKEGSNSKIEVIDRNQKRDMERVLQSVGTSLSDVFGADNILWVEGPTEERCFPEIIRSDLCKHDLQGTVVKGVVATGDFVQKKKKNVELVLDVYRRLTTSSALLPPAFGFVFDTENLSPDGISDIERTGTDNGVKRVVFLPRTMYENYLLCSEAIAYILSKDSGNTITSNQIQTWFDDNLWETENGQRQWNKKYFGGYKPSGLNFEDCLETIHGANVLKALFIALTPNGFVEYDKVSHGYDLTRWLLENKPEQLQPLADFLDEQMTHWKGQQIRPE
jgi:predicted ATPase